MERHQQANAFGHPEPPAQLAEHIVDLILPVLYPALAGLLP